MVLVVDGGARYRAAAREASLADAIGGKVKGLQVSAGLHRARCGTQKLYRRVSCQIQLRGELHSMEEAADHCKKYSQLACGLRLNI